MYIDDDGNKHDSYQDYCNSSMLYPDIVATYLIVWQAHTTKRLRETIASRDERYQEAGIWD